MKAIKIFFAALLIAVFIVPGFAGGRQAKPEKAAEKINVTSVIFPSYDFFRAVAGDRVNLTMLLPPGAESHSYEPSPRDIVTVMESDLFIYTGGETDIWVDRILGSLDSGSMDSVKVLKMLDLVEAVEEEIVEGMEDDEHEHGHDEAEHDEHDEAEHHEHDEEVPVYDEHVWTSPRNAKLIVAAIAESLCALDGANADFYRKNAADYTARLDELDAEFQSIVNNAERNTLIVGDRFPFRYLIDAYGLSYFAAFPGCSTETEPSAATVAFLINKVKAEQIPVVFYIELSNEKMADTISEATGAKKLLLHSCHNVTRNEFENGVNYIDLQKQNVKNLREALGAR